MGNTAMAAAGSLADTTYEITFYDRRDRVDSVQQYNDSKEAWDMFRLYDEPDSADLYSCITLTQVDWRSGSKGSLLEILFF